MKFSSQEDVALPIEEVFAAISDFEVFERRAMRRGAQVSRTDPATGPGLGSVWDARFAFRGKEREVRGEVTTCDAPAQLAVASKSGGLSGVFGVELVALAPQRTRMIVGLELTPGNLSSRLLLQSLKLAKTTLSARCSKAVTDYARSLDAD